MKLRIPVLVFLGIAIPAVTGALVMAAALSFGLQRGFESYLAANDEAQLDAVLSDLTNTLNAGTPESTTITDRSLLSLVENAGLRFDAKRMRPPPDPNHAGRQPPPPERFPNRLLLLSNDDTNLAGPLLPRGSEHAARVMKKPIVVHGRKVGFLGVLPRAPVPAGIEVQFLDNQYRTAFMLLFCLVIAALVPAWFIARTSGRTVNRFAAATNAIAQGSYETHTPESRVKEVAEVAGHIAEMGARLRRLETSRRRWLAEISHELRTPLSAIRGELEALVDGVRPATPQAIDSLLKEALHLSRLVDDLHFLAVSDLSGPTCQFEQLDAVRLIDEVVAKLRVQATASNMQLAFENGCEGTATVYWDRDRIEQILANTIGNSLRYSDPGGKIEVTLAPARGGVNIIIDDTPPGVSQAHLERLFEPLYRVEQSRSRASGGSGLGLSLVERIVSAHHGEVTASPSPLGGLRLTIFLPNDGRPQ